MWVSYQCSVVCGCVGGVCVCVCVCVCVAVLVVCVAVYCLYYPK